MSDYDKRQWQAEQEARDAEAEKQREKFARARERSARNAKRKLERLKTKLTEEGEISEFEAEFSESVLERIDEFGTAFNDPQLGRPGDALSAAQKKVVAGMNRKAKELRKKAKTERQAAKLGVSVEAQQAEEERKQPRRYSSFKNKKSKNGWSPRVRQLDEDFDDAPAPEAAPEPNRPESEDSEPPRPPVGKPFLRIVK